MEVVNIKNAQDYSVLTKSSKINERKHAITRFRNVKHTTNGVSSKISLGELHEEFLRLANKARGLPKNLTPDGFRRRKLSATAIAYGQFRDNKREKAALIGRSLLSIDIDQKESNLTRVLTVDDIVSLLEELHIDSVVHTSASHCVKQPCIRLIADIGDVVDEPRFRAVTDWMIRKLGDAGLDLSTVDSVSRSCAQAMIVPCLYCHERPTVRRVEGSGVLDLYQQEVDAIEVAVQKARAKASNNHRNVTSTGANACLDEDVQALFRAQVSNLYKAVRYAQATKHSLQFHRNSADPGPGLFATEEMHCIIDPSRDEIYKVQYSPLNYHKALNHSLPPRSQVAEDIRKWIDSDVKYAVLKENCGSGKSQSLLQLTHDDPRKQRYIFTFATRTNRDTFVKQAANCKTVKGVVEIIQEGIADENRAKQALRILDTHYSSYQKKRHKLEHLRDKPTPDHIKGFKKHLINERAQELVAERSLDRVLNECMHTGIITQPECEHIRREYDHHRNALNTSSEHLVMTTKKLEYVVSYAEEAKFEQDVVFTDEVTPGMLTDIDPAQRYRVYGGYYSLEDDENIEKSRLRSLKRCLVTVEDCIEYELKRNKLRYTSISGVVPTLDENLEIVWVHTTSNMVNSKGTRPRANICYVIEQEFGDSINIIANGLGNKYNMVNNKGLNDLSSHDLAVILSQPSPDEIARMMAATGLSENDAKNLIMSDNANQAIGRNQGYRNRDNKGNPSKGSNRCLLVCPYRNGIELSLHYVTDRVTKAGSWNDTNSSRRIPDKTKAKFYFRHVIERFESSNEYTSTTDDAIKLTNSLMGYLQDNSNCQYVPIKDLDIFAQGYTVRIVADLARKSGFKVSQRTSKKLSCIDLSNRVHPVGF